MPSIKNGSENSRSLDKGSNRALSFIVDAMLGDMARWLRLLGYDTIYAGNMRDPEIARLAMRENRVLLTRDKGLYIFAKHRGVKVLLLSDEANIVERLAYVSKKLGIELIVDPNRSRCPVCNGRLVKVKDKKLVMDKVPRRVYETYSEFWVCTRCGQVYWRGSHWRSIERIVMEARRIIKNPGGRGRSNL
ncbi:MAG: Mut7-C RNAse domain-containing protein [Pyrodictiaceae archaeon]